MDLIESLTEAGMHFRASILDRYKLNSIFIEAQPAAEVDLGLAKSRIGGCPDAPKNFKWPRHRGKPLSFIAQFNLQALLEHDKDHRLPGEGMLSFFCAGDDVSGHDNDDKGGFKAYHFKEPILSLERKVAPEKAFALPPSKLKFSSEYCYPIRGNLESCGLDDAVEERYDNDSDPDNPFEYLDILSKCASNRKNIRLLGYPDLIQGGIFESCQMGANGIIDKPYSDPKHKKMLEGRKDWTLLFQLDLNGSIPGWGASVVLYFAIKKKDLAKGDFDEVWLVKDCR
ncbi:MAG: DUF1963 domain-containing protein [Clostridiales bacterium]|nr:DUF1963 domain-containing protein [Clostridiales bacterium]